MSDISNTVDTRKRILIAEDRDNLRDLLRTMCATTGHDVYAVEDGLQALAFYRTGCPDLIITDFEMPNMDGFQLLENIQQSGNGVPVVLASGSDFAREEVLRQGFADYLPKPYSLGNLTECIKRYLG